jgi:hypothetical protein
MKRGIITGFLAFLVIASLASSGFSQEQKESTCISCHELLEDELLRPVQVFKNDVHQQIGLSCDDCHGGDPTSEDPDVAMSLEKGFRGAPGPLEIPKFCARCHSNTEYMRKYNPALNVDQFEKYLTSVHGKRNAKGDKKVAQCVSCHGVHDIRPASDPLSKVNDINVPRTCASCHSDPLYMKAYNIPTDQFFKYSRSVHGIALLEDKDTAAPACNDCHGNHGAVPPGVSSIAYVCGNCHVNNMDLFNAGPMKEAFSKLHLPGCETCHGNHGILKPTDAIVGVGAQSVCLNCHSEKNRPKGYKVAQEIKDQLMRLTQKEAEVDSILYVADQKGMDILDAEYKRREVRQALIEARTMVHSFDPKRVKEKVEVGIKAADVALSIGRKAIKNYYFRRKWWGISTLVISFLALAIFLKIREMDKSGGEKT